MIHARKGWLGLLALGLMTAGCGEILGISDATLDPGAAGSDSDCTGKFDYPAKFGGAPCQTCAEEVACKELLACDDPECSDLLACYQTCEAIHDAPCLASCQQMLPTGAATFGDLHFALAANCFAPCGYTAETLCNTSIPAHTSNCKTAVEKDCCAVVEACESDAGCRDCASVAPAASCADVPLFQGLIGCLSGLQGTCGF